MYGGPVRAGIRSRRSALADEAPLLVALLLTGGVPPAAAPRLVGQALAAATVVVSVLALVTVVSAPGLVLLVLSLLGLAVRLAATLAVCLAATLAVLPEVPLVPRRLLAAPVFLALLP